MECGFDVVWNEAVFNHEIMSRFFNFMVFDNISAYVSGHFVSSNLIVTCIDFFGSDYWPWFVVVNYGVDVINFNVKFKICLLVARMIQTKIWSLLAVKQ